MKKLIEDNRSLIGIFAIMVILAVIFIILVLMVGLENLCFVGIFVVLIPIFWMIIKFTPPKFKLYAIAVFCIISLVLFVLVLL